MVGWGRRGARAEGAAHAHGARTASQPRRCRRRRCARSRTPHARRVRAHPLEQARSLARRVRVRRHRRELSRQLGGAQAHLRAVATRAVAERGERVQRVLREHARQLELGGLARAHRLDDARARLLRHAELSVRHERGECAERREVDEAVELVRRGETGELLARHPPRRRVRRREPERKVLLGQRASEQLEAGGAVERAREEPLHVVASARLRVAEVVQQPLELLGLAQVRRRRALELRETRAVVRRHLRVPGTDVGPSALSASAWMERGLNRHAMADA